jgi:hypothetical protein
MPENGNRSNKENTDWRNPEDRKLREDNRNNICKHHQHDTIVVGENFKYCRYDRRN